jgi:catechol 2,3-dioxygenase-like lactoylglutathione lyase family enzyme
VAEAARHGLSNPAIARRLGVSLDAVKQHLASVLQKLALPSKADLRRWSGVRRDSRLYAKETIMASGSALGTIGQIARRVTDVGEAERWYRDTLGLRHLYSFAPMAFFDCGGVRLLLTEGEGPGDSLLYFKVDDIQGAQRALTERGVSFTHAAHLVHRHPDGVEEWMAFFTDNEGRPLALMAQV